MATGSILLPIGAATLPDGSSGNAAPAIQRVQSSASSPKAHFLQAAFDASTDEMMMWSFRMPQDYASDLVAKVQYKMASATSGAVVFAGQVAAVTAGDSTDVDAKAFGTVNTASADTVAGTAGHMKEVSWAQSNADSLAAGDYVVFRLARDADNAADTATGDCEVIGVSLEYTVS